MKNYLSLRLSDLGGFFLVLFSLSAFAQLSEPEHERPLKSDKYLFPIRPGVTGSLAGTMGELRSTHFHTGIDIRTNNEIGWPVLAAKGGYISRITMTSSGYGNVLYIKHPDGNTTLYGHLNEFRKDLADYALREKYRRKSSSIDLYFRENQFAVKQGDTVAFAGNTGSSSGPHLHFDIRDANMDALDPLKFGFTEVNDIAPPIAQKIALKTLDINSRINDQYGRFEFYLLKSGNDYKLNYPILASGTIGIELLGYDRIDSYRFKMGINFIDVYVDGEKIFSQSIEKVDVSESRSILALIDYKTQIERGTRFYKLYLEDGNKQKFYSTSPGNGYVKIDPTKTSDVKIVMRDIYDHTSTVSFQLKPTPVVEEVRTLGPAGSASYEIQKNTLVVSARPCETTKIIVYGDNTSYLKDPSYFNSLNAVYLFDLRKGVPDSIKLCTETIVTNIKASIPSQANYKYYSDWLDIQFPARSLYDTVYFQASHTVTDETEEFMIGNPAIPLNRNIHVSIKPAHTYSTEKNVAIYRKVRNYHSYEGGTWLNGRLNFYTRDFGNYVILTDSIPPTISRIYVNSTVARFKIRDNLSGIADWEATINGQWLLMTFDAKSGTLFSEKLNKDMQLKGDFRLVVTDVAGNKQEYVQKIL